MLDILNARSSYTQPTPRGGGLGILVTEAGGSIGRELYRQW
jgi:FlaA1/EpsC-like NDP-sugar epimerase